MSLAVIFLKLVLAVALGGLIGLEREASLKPAGFRTNIIVCTGSAVLMILAGLLIASHGGGADTLVRMAAGAITGIGFLGAGTILQARGAVVGLTTASTLWLVAGLGLVIGAGYYVPALLVTALVLLTLALFGKIEKSFLPHGHHHYHVRAAEGSDVPARIRRLAIHHGVRLEHWWVRREGGAQLVGFSFAAGAEKENEFHQALLELDADEIRVD